MHLKNRILATKQNSPDTKVFSPRFFIFFARCFLRCALTNWTPGRGWPNRRRHKRTGEFLFRIRPLVYKQQNHSGTKTFRIRHETTVTHFNPAWDFGSSYLFKVIRYTVWYKVKTNWTNSPSLDSLDSTQTLDVTTETSWGLCLFRSVSWRNVNVYVIGHSWGFSGPMQTNSGKSHWPNRHEDY